MAIFGPEFNKELEQESGARKELIGQTEAMSKKIESTTNAIGEYSQKIQENEKAMEGLDKRTKEYKNLIAENSQLEEDKGELLKQRDEEKEEKAGLEKLTPTFKDMQESLFNISDAELEKRQVFDKQIKQQEELLEEFKRTNPEAEMEIAKEEANLQVMKDKEQKRRENQQLGIFKRGFKGIQAGISGLGKALSKLPTSAKLGLSIAAYFALAAFLKSDMFKKFAKFIQNDLIPAVKKAFEFLMRPGGPFDGLKEALSGIIDFAVGLYKTISGIFTGDMKLFEDGMGQLTDGFFEFVKGILKAVLTLFGGDKAAEFVDPIIDGIRDFIKITVGGIFDFAKTYIGNIFTLFTDVFDGVSMIIEGDILGGIKKILLAPFKYIYNQFKAIFNSVIETVGSLAKRFFGIEIPNPFDDTSDELPLEDKAADAIRNAGFDIDKKIDKSPDTITADKEKPQVSKNTVINNSNVVQQGDSVQANYSQRYVKDQESSFANAM